MALTKDDLEQLATVVANRQPTGFFEDNKKAIIGAVIGLAVMWGAMQRDLFTANQTREETQSQRITQERILTELQQIKERLNLFESELRDRTASRYTQADAQRDLKAQTDEHIRIWEAINRNAVGIESLTAAYRERRRDP